MSNKNHRSGGKFCKSHTTVIPFAGQVVDVVKKISSVSKIQLGLIKSGLKNPRNEGFVKISSDDSVIILGVRGNTSHQQIIIFTNLHQYTKLLIAKTLRDNKIPIRFGK